MGTQGRPHVCGRREASGSHDHSAIYADRALSVSRGVTGGSQQGTEGIQGVGASISYSQMVNSYAIYL